MNRIVRGLKSITWAEWLLIGMFVVLAIGSRWR